MASCMVFGGPGNSSVSAFKSQQSEPHVATRISRNKMWKKREQETSPLDLNELKQNPDSDTYALLLRRCGRAKALSQGKRVHLHMFKAGLDKNVRLSNLLVQMYGECGSLEDAKRVFDLIPERNIFSWNIMLSAFTHNGDFKTALELYETMSSRMKPDGVTYVILLSACSSLGALREGQIIHASIITGGHESHPVIATALVNMYGKCRNVKEARMVFDKIVKRDVVCWNAMISAYALNGDGETALQLYWKMQYTSPVKPDAATFVAALDACSVINSLSEGKKIHARIVSRKMEMDMIVATALISMYSKCGCLQESIALFNRMVFRSVITWTAMLGAFAQQGEYKEVLKLYERMKVDGVKMDFIIFSIILEACSMLEAFSKGREVHADLETSSVEMNLKLAAALINMYASCDKLEVARAMVCKKRNSLLWNELIRAYARKGYSRDALAVYDEMPVRGIRPDRNTFINVLEACGSSGALAEGRRIHTDVIAKAYDADPVIGAALVSMYSKCGSLLDSEVTFKAIPRKNNVILWSTMIAAYGQHKHAEQAFSLLSEMSQRGLYTNKLTFVGVLSACRSFEQALLYFQLMVQDHDVYPTEEHYGAVIDCLGRAGKLRQAEELIDSIPFEPSSKTWLFLLNACVQHRDVKLGRRAAERIFRIEPRNGLAYLTLGKIYAQAEMWDELVELKKLMEERVLKVQPSAEMEQPNTEMEFREPVRNYESQHARDLTLKPP